MKFDFYGMVEQYLNGDRSRAIGAVSEQVIDDRDELVKAMDTIINTLEKEI